MPFGTVNTRRIGRRIVIEIELPDHGEPSDSGRAENLVDPRAWRGFDDEYGRLAIKMTVCRPYHQRRSSFPD